MTATAQWRGAFLIARLLCAAARLLCPALTPRGCFGLPGGLRSKARNGRDDLERRKTVIVATRLRSPQRYFTPAGTRAHVRLLHVHLEGEYDLVHNDGR